MRVREEKEINKKVKKTKTKLNKYKFNIEQ